MKRYEIIYSNNKKVYKTTFESDDYIHMVSTMLDGPYYWDELISITLLPSEED